MTAPTSALAMRASDALTDFARGLDSELGHRLWKTSTKDWSDWNGSVPADLADVGVLQRTAITVSKAAIPFAASGEILSIMREAAALLPDDACLHPGDSPCEDGFLWLETPVPIKAMEHSGASTVAVMWTQLEDAVLVWGLANLPSARVPMFPWASAYLAYDKPLCDPDDHDVRSGDLLLMAKLFVSFLRFVGEVWVDDSPERPPRAAAKRAARAGVADPVVRVVRLRKRAQSASSSQHHDVEWQRQWVVRGHWRNQWYPSVQAHRPRWIPSYVKGPDDKPLVVSGEIFVADR